MCISNCSSSAQLLMSMASSAPRSEGRESLSARAHRRVAEWVTAAFVIPAVKHSGRAQKRARRENREKKGEKEGKNEAKMDGKMGRAGVLVEALERRAKDAVVHRVILHVPEERSLQIRERAIKDARERTATVQSGRRARTK